MRVFLTVFLLVFGFVGTPVSGQHTAMQEFNVPSSEFQFFRSDQGKCLSLVRHSTGGFPVIVTKKFYVSSDCVGFDQVFGPISESIPGVIGGIVLHIVDPRTGGKSEWRILEGRIVNGETFLPITIDYRHVNFRPLPAAPAPLYLFRFGNQYLYVSEDKYTHELSVFVGPPQLMAGIEVSNVEKYRGRLLVQTRLGGLYIPTKPEGPASWLKNSLEQLEPKDFLIKVSGAAASLASRR